MKKVLVTTLFLIFLSAPPTFFDEQRAEYPVIAAQSYIVMDATSGQILVHHQSDVRRFPASTTKIMTVALALELCGADWSSQITVSEAAISAVGKGSSSVFLQPGEILTLSDVLYAVILESANDGANVLAEYAAGSISAFVALMNEKALSLGMLDTHFSNPSGWQEDEHYTTALDMAKLTQWALSVPGFTDILQVENYIMQPTNKHPSPRLFESDNLLLSSALFYPGIIGGKSGWTPEARFTMMEAVQRDNHTLIAIVLDCPQKFNRFSDCIALFDYCFDSFHLVSLDNIINSSLDIPVLRNNTELGRVPLKTDPSFFLPNNYAVDNIYVEYSIPDQYNFGTSFDASVTLYLKENLNIELCTLPLFPDSDALDELLSNSSSSGRTHTDKRHLFLMGVLLSLLAAVLSFRASRLDKIRRKSFSRTLKHMRQTVFHSVSTAEDLSDTSVPYPHAYE